MRAIWAKFTIPVLASILILGSLGLTQQTFAQIPPGFVDFNGHCYGLTSLDTWANTELEAVSLGGHLVTINDAAENAFLQSLPVGAAWIGYNDIAVEGTFEWVSGEVVVPLYENWSPGEPNNLGNEDVVVIRILVGDWNDLPSFKSDVLGIIELDVTCEVAFGVAPPPIIEVEIDIKPGSDPNSVNCKANKKGDINGVVPVAIFGSENFDVIDIEIVSMSLVGSEPIQVFEVHDKLHIEDLNEDGFDDAVLHLDKAEVCEATEDAPLKESVDVELSGETTDETQFVGIGDIRIVKR